MLCIVGVVVPWFYLLGFLTEPQPAVALFFWSIFANQVTSSVAADLLISALVFFVFVRMEGRRLGMKRLWVLVPATLLVGLSLGLPLFLHLRAKHVEEKA
jgi:membrane associated rhomboid family serine protease